MKKIFIVLMLFVAIGCSKKYTPPPEDIDTFGDTTMEDVTPGMEEEIIEERIIVEEDIVSESTLPIEEQAKEVFQDVYFDYDKYDIKPASRPLLDSVAAFLSKNKGLNIVVEGHCDDRGTNEYNLALGEKRAKAVKNYLSSRGVSPERAIVITFGEEKPVCMEQSESCWQKNRRAHFVSVTSRFQ